MCASCSHGFPLGKTGQKGRSRDDRGFEFVTLEPRGDMPVPHAWKMGLAGISEYFSEATGVFGVWDVVYAGRVHPFPWWREDNI